MANELLITLLVNAAVFSVLFLLFLPARRLLGRRLSPAAALLLWAVLAVKLVIPFGFESNLSLLPPRPASVGGLDQAMTPITDLLEEERLVPKEIKQQPASGGPEAGQPAHAPFGQALAEEGEISPAVGNAARPLNVPLLLLGLWAAGAAAVAAVLLAGAANLRRRVQRARTVVPPCVLEAFEHCRRELGIRRGVLLMLSGATGAPIVMGALRPVLVLPEDAGLLSGEALRHVLAHELMHIRRGDLWALRCMNLLCAVYWFTPAVWAWSKLVRADLETACDHSVLRLIGRSQRLSYISTVLEFTGRSKAGRLAAAMGIGDGLPAMEKRIAGMYRSPRTKAGGRAVAAAVALILLSASVLTACQPTPTKNPVVGKDGASLEEMINATPAPAGEGNAAVPCERNFKSADGTVAVSVRAKAEIPARLPVVRVTPYFIPMEQVKAMAQVLLRGSQPWEAGAGMTRAEIQKALLAARHDMEQYVLADNALRDHYNGDQTALDAAKARYEWQISAYEKLYAAAPETVKRKATDWTFQPDAYYQDMTVYGDLTGSDEESQKTKSMLYDSKVIQLSADLENCRAYLEARNLDTSGEVSHYAGFFSGTTPGDDGIVPRWSADDLKPICASKDEVITFVTDSLAKMGIKNMALNVVRAYGKPETAAAPRDNGEALQAAAGHRPDDVDKVAGEVYGYSLTFVPVYEGVAAVDTGVSIEQNEDQYGPTYNYESLLVNVYGVAGADGPMITSLQWSNPMETAKVENPSVAVLSLDEALELFQAHMDRAYTLERLAADALLYGDFEQYKGKIKSAEIGITAVTLGLVRVRVANSPGAYRMVPAWVFRGTEKLTVDGLESPVESPRTVDGLYSYAVINAVDGSIIDPALGY